MILTRMILTRICMILTRILHDSYEDDSYEDLHDSYEDLA